MTRAAFTPATRTEALVRALVLLVLFALLLPGAARAEEGMELAVADAYAELRSGPGRGYPVFHVVERGGRFTLVKRRTDWYLVETGDGTRGWMSAAEVARARAAGGRRVELPAPGREAWSTRRLELGFAAGDFDGDTLFAVRAAWRLSEHFVLEGAWSHAAGTFSSTTLWQANLQVLPFAAGRVAPYFTLGTGRLSNEPKSTLVDAESVSDWAGNAGLGLRAWFTGRFLLRADARRYVFTRDINNNDAFTEWTLGFSVFL